MSDFDSAAQKAERVIVETIEKIQQKVASEEFNQFKPEFRSGIKKKFIQDQLFEIDGKLDDVVYEFEKMERKVNKEISTQGLAYEPLSKGDKMDLHLQTLTRVPHLEVMSPEELIAYYQKPRDLESEDARIEMQIIENEGERILKAKKSPKAGTFKLLVEKTRAARISEVTTQTLSNVGKYRRLYEQAKVMRSELSQGILSHRSIDAFFKFHKPERNRVGGGHETLKSNILRQILE
jgi:hypothetical protein